MKSDPLSRAARVRSDAYVFLGKKLWPGSVRAFACSVCAGQHSSPPDSRGYAPPMPKTRLDALLVQRGLFETRSRAAAAVLAGTVRLGEDGLRAEKPGQFVFQDVVLRIDSAPPYVSRGGAKLAGALDAFAIDPHGRRCLDVGDRREGIRGVAQGAADDGWAVLGLSPSRLTGPAGNRETFVWIAEKDRADAGIDREVEVGRVDA